MLTTFSYTEIDRMFYERLRLKVVAMGLLPNITLYSTKSAYDSARRTLRQSLLSQGKSMVDVIGVGAWDDRDEKTDARIVINRGNDSMGSIGGFPAMEYEIVITNGVKTFNKYHLPDATDDLSYEVRIMSDKLDMERVLSFIVKTVLKHRHFFNTVGSSGSFTSKSVLVESVGGFDMSDRRNLERAYRYVVKDVFIEEPELLDANIKPLSTIHFDISLQDGSDTSFDVVTPGNPNTGGCGNLPYRLPFNLCADGVGGSHYLPFSLPFNLYN